MTCREKWMINRPDRDPVKEGLCVAVQGIRRVSQVECSNTLCMYCWDQEIPEKTKEDKPMTKKTKAELLEELEAANQVKADLEKQIKNLEKYKEIQDCADELKAIHTAFMNSGFTNEQAFTLLKTAMDSLLPSIIKGMRT